MTNVHCTHAYKVLQIYFIVHDENWLKIKPFKRASCTVNVFHHYRQTHKYYMYLFLCTMCNVQMKLIDAIHVQPFHKYLPGYSPQYDRWRRGLSTWPHPLLKIQMSYDCCLWGQFYLMSLLFLQLP